jgi:selenocysteine lyase/cysteine desulfurase
MAALHYLDEIGQQYGGEAASLYPQFRGRRLHFKTAMTTLAAYERALVRRLIEMLQGVPGVEIAGITDPARYHERVPTVVFTLAGYSPRAVAEHLAARDIYVWDGNYYALAIMDRLGKEESGGMVRVGLAHYNTHREIDCLEAVLRELAT